MSHGIFDHGHRTIGGEGILFLIVAAVIVTLLYMNGWHLTRRYAVADVNGRTASRHFTPYGAHRAAQVMNRHAGDKLYHIIDL